MRFILAAVLLLYACSTKTPRSDAQAQADATLDVPGDMASDHPVQCPGASASGFPCCYFSNSAATPQAGCDPAECMILLDAGAPPDAGDPSCRPCPNGYACAIGCPSPLGGCGGPPTCCRVQQ